MHILISEVSGKNVFTPIQLIYVYNKLLQWQPNNHIITNNLFKGNSIGTQSRQIESIHY